MHFTKISGATAVFLISMISASPIQFSDISFATRDHLRPTATFVPMDSAADKSHPTTMEPHPTAFSASDPEFTALPSGGFQNAPHHFFPFSSSSTNINTANLPTATPAVTDDDSEETSEMQTRATKGGNKTSGSGTSNAGGGGAKKRNASANSGGSSAKGSSSGNGNGSSGGSADEGVRRKRGL
ncbi:hypothetical protein EAF04_008724 [Stromatinia cepivora]|nr:hypothetical protein EAF04_008724 [Stromatinia cepivora]